MGRKKRLAHATCHQHTYIHLPLYRSSALSVSTSNCIGRHLLTRVFSPQELDDIDDDLDFDEDELEDYGSSASSAIVDPSPPSTPPSGFGESEDGDGGNLDAGDDLLDI